MTSFEGVQCGIGALRPLSLSPILAFTGQSGVAVARRGYTKLPRCEGLAPVMPPRVPTSQSTSADSVRLHIPTDLSCLVLYEPLGPNYGNQPIRVGSDGGNKFWAPPNRKDAYIRDKAGARLFRWEGGRMRDITATDFGNQQGFSVYSVATIFTQYRDTNHLLAVTFDAERRDVAEEYGGWKVLSFDHERQQGTQRTYYSSVGVAGDQQQLAAPGSPAWMPQLLPAIYNYDASQSPVQPISAGLIGNLAILLALPAFSAQPQLLSHILISYMLPNHWVHHGFAHGHNKERGMVVTVYLDPSNKKGSTPALLDQLQNGYFGPFYGA